MTTFMDVVLIKMARLFGGLFRTHLTFKMEHFVKIRLCYEQNLDTTKCSKYLVISDVKMPCYISDKVFKNGTSKICGRQPLITLKAYVLLKADYTLSNYLKGVFHNFTLSISEYFVPFVSIQRNNMKNGLLLVSINIENLDIISNQRVKIKQSLNI